MEGERRAVFCLLLFFATLSIAAHGEDYGRKDYGKSSGELGPFTVGPVVTALGIPTPFRVGAEVKYRDLAAISFDYGFIPSISVSDVGISYHCWRTAVRIHPFQGAFFIGLGFGQQSFSGSTTRSTLGISVNYNLAIDSTLLVPHVGWRWQWSSGFFFGMEIGVQVPLSSSSTESDDAPALVKADPTYGRNKKDVENQGNNFAQIPLPHLALVQVGMLF